MQLPEIKEPVCSQAGQTVSAHSLASMGDGCVSECISPSPSLSAAVFRYGNAYCATSIFRHSLGEEGRLPPSTRPALFQGHSVILPPTKTALHSPSRDPSVSPRSFPTSSLGGSAVCGPVFEPSTSKRFHVAPHAHLYGITRASNFAQVKQQRSKFCRLS